MNTPDLGATSLRVLVYTVYVVQGFPRMNWCRGSDGAICVQKRRSQVPLGDLMRPALEGENAQTSERVDGGSSVCDLLKVAVHAKDGAIWTME